MNWFICPGRSSIPFLCTQKLFSTSVIERDCVREHAKHPQNNKSLFYFISHMKCPLQMCSEGKSLHFPCSSDSFQNSSSLILLTSPDKRHLCLLQKMDYTNKKITLQTSPTSKNKSVTVPLDCTDSLYSLLILIIPL